MLLTHVSIDLEVSSLHVKTLLLYNLNHQAMKAARFRFMNVFLPSYSESLTMPILRYSRRTGREVYKVRFRCNYRELGPWKIVVS